MTNKRNILRKLFLVGAGFFILAGLVVFNLIQIQFINGKKYKQLAQIRAYKKVEIPANRGNIYDKKGNLLATSVPKYDIHFDPITVIDQAFEKYVGPLSEKLAQLLGKTPSYYRQRMRRARAQHNRYLSIAENLGYLEYAKIREFPLFKLGPYDGGLIVEKQTVRERPFGGLAARTIGQNRVGLEGAYNYYLAGNDGRQVKQKIAQGQWKPISGAKEIDPENGKDIISTLNINMQDIVHHALLEQLKQFEADHGTAVLMEVETGAIKAMANLGRTESGYYYEKRNYAVWEAQEPGSTFKLMSMVAALEDNVVDTGQVFDTEDGTVRYYDRVVRDAHRGGYGKVSAARAFEVSSNTAFSKIIYQGYHGHPEDFINRLQSMGLGEKIGLPILGEGEPFIPHPGGAKWYGTTLPWLSFGYGLKITPLQTLAFYNAIANDGVRVKPHLLKAVRDGNRIIRKIDNPVIVGTVCSKETAKIMQEIMANTVKRGTGAGIYDPDFPMSGKTGTGLVGYGDGNGEMKYVASFAGYFPAKNPKYSCIVVINDPNQSIGFYGSQVAAPVFEEIAHKIHRQIPETDTLFNIKPQYAKIKKDYRRYRTLDQSKKMPEVIGMPAMDAISMLENLGLEVEINGPGTVQKQSIEPGKKLKNQNKIWLRTS